MTLEPPPGEKPGAPSPIAPRVPLGPPPALGTPPALGARPPLGTPPALGAPARPVPPRVAGRPAPAYKGLPTPVRVIAWVLFAVLIGLVIGATAPTALRRVGATAALQPGLLAWYAVRTLGFLAYFVLAASVLYGLLLSTKILDSIAHRPVSFALHKDLSIIGMILAGLHGIVLLGDGSYDFNLRAILVPFASPYAPITVGIGQLVFYGSIVIVLTFYVRRLIGQRVWRLVHYLTFLSFAGASFHGISSGSDSGSAWAFWVYVALITATIFLLTYRLVVGVSNRIRSLRPAPATAPVVPALPVAPHGPLDRPSAGGFLRWPS